jgi:hypothetical protein
LASTSSTKCSLSNNNYLVNSSVTCWHVAAKNCMGEVNCTLKFPICSDHLRSHNHTTSEMSCILLVSCRNEESTIASIFLVNMVEFKVYGEFIKASPRANKTLAEWSGKEPKIAKLLQMFEVISTFLQVFRTKQLQILM